MKAPDRHWWASGTAAIGATVIHVSLIAPLVMATARHKPRLPDQIGAGASAQVASSELATSMTLVDLQQDSTSEESPLERLASEGIELPQSALMIASPEPTFAPDLDEDATEDRTMTEAAGDTSGHAAMFGRYIGQINARIERAWLRPRDPIESGRFSCQTKIEQDANGKVLSIELRHCNGNVSWQQSLVSAIEHASPLPSPPIPSVFAGRLILNFGSNAYEAGISDERAYQPEIRVADANVQVAASNQQIESPTPELTNFRGSIHLNIEGKKVTWELEPGQRTSTNAGTTDNEPENQ